MARALIPVLKRFRLAYLLLAVLLGMGIGAFVVLVARPSEPDRPWSTFRPEGEGLAAAEQIADTVGARYALPSGKQLVGVLAQQPRIGEDVTLSAVAVTSGLPDQPSEDVEVFRTNNTLLYVLCGIGGEQCSIPEGTPSTQRLTLLRREALELALYTFKYLGDTDAVLAILPPAPGQQPSNAAYFRRSDFAYALDKPLEQTLPPAEQLTPERLSDQEARYVRSLTLPDPIKKRFSGMYQFQFQQVPDGTALVALAPV